MLKGGWKVSECLGSDANLATISWTEPDHLCCEWLSESSETAISVSQIPKHFCVRKTCLKPEYQQTVIRHDHAAHVEGTEWRVGKSKPVTSSREKKKKRKSYPHRDELKLDHHCCGRESRRTLWKRFSPTSKLGVIQTWLSALVTQKFIMIMFYKWSHQSKNLLHQTCCTAAQLFFSAASFNPDWLPPNSF